MNKYNARVTPITSLDVLSQHEVAQLCDMSQGGLHDLLHGCSLAVLNCGSEIDDGRVLLEEFKDYSIAIIQQERGIKLELKNAPSNAFVDGELIVGIKEHLFSVLRDIVYVKNEIDNNSKFDLCSSGGITNAIFQILRNAKILKANINPNLVVCWGGHSISRVEYLYTKEVGYEMGLRGIHVCTGCGPGAMKGPMKGATIGHAKQRINDGNYIGLTEPGIIAAESPNPIVNNLVIFPDIEKRLEAFVRLANCIVVFPGGAGTAEEILYLLGILLHPDNSEIPFPLIFTGPKCCEHYFKEIHHFIEATLGFEAQQKYKIIIDDPEQVAREVKRGIDDVYQFRKSTSDAFYFNWLLKINDDFQRPFNPTHENMAKLELHHDQPKHHLAANLRRAFSGIVSGNVKDEGVRLIEKKGPYEIKGNPEILKPLDKLLASFVEQHRMKLPGSVYHPCYQIID
ncbi:MAG: LOG family protein [Methylococcales bacterium]|jgi:pyrimidine/purine-5'-nucleotide nucleosidase|nr:LOG family protein [Methylococcales bacterium]MBT7409477.1 LOG family protein [Methylococcales bacterium]